MEELLKEHQQLGTNSEFEISVEVATFFDHTSTETLKHSKLTVHQVRMGG